VIPRRPGAGGPPGDKTLPTPDPAAAQIIRSYGPGRFLIGQREWTGPVLVTPLSTAPWNVTAADELSLDMVAALGADLLVVGCGPRSIFIAPDKRLAFKAAGIGLEVVDTGAACRIYNVLLAEGRRVAAALIPL
jgi:uncharacterized protein